MRGFYYFGQPTYYIYYDVDGKILKIKFVHYGRSTGIWGNIVKKYKRKFIFQRNNFLPYK